MHCRGKAERYNVLSEEKFKIWQFLAWITDLWDYRKIFSLNMNHRGVLWLMSFACQSSLNEFRISKWQRPSSRLLQMMRTCKTKKHYNSDTFCTEAKMTVRVCLSQYVCAWGSDAKRSFYDHESHVSSIRAPNSQAPASPHSGSATRRNNSSALPVGDQSRGCCCAVWALPARPWCEAFPCILGSEAKNDVLVILRN